MIATRSHILVVEDDHPTREFYRSVLRIAGYAVEAVEDGVDALRRLESNTPSLVVLDLELPRLPGLDFYRELKAGSNTHAIPVMVVTGGDTSHLSLDDFACVLKKPVSPAQLITTVHACLHRAKRVAT